MICPYSKERIDCFKFGPYTVPPGPCCKCTVPNPIKAKYFHMPELDDGEYYQRCDMCGGPVDGAVPMCGPCYLWLREGSR